MAIPNYPVWSIKPNWANSVTETLEWLTDVIAGTNGVEQRRALRRSPRRSFEFTVNPIDNERTFLDLCFTRLPNMTFLLPLWHDKARADAAAIGATRIAFDNTFREFTDYAIVYVDAFNYELVEISGQDDTGIDIVTPLVGAIGAKQPVYPIRTAFLADSGSYAALSPRVGQAQVKFTVNESTAITVPDETRVLYDGSPIFSSAPDWGTDQQTDITTLRTILDNQTGLVFQQSDTERSFGTQAYDIFAVGRAQQTALRQTLYRQAGRAKDLWLPTFKRDIKLAADRGSGSNNLLIEKIGLGYVGGPASGREYVYFPHSGEVAKIDSLGASGDVAKELLNTHAPTVNGYVKGTIASFMDRGRLSTDSITIEHRVDSDGPVSVSLPITFFEDSRDPSGSIYCPIPAGAKTSSPCGTSEADNPCIPFFRGWYWKLIYHTAKVGGTGNRVPNRGGVTGGLGFQISGDGFGEETDVDNWTYGSYFGEDTPSGTSCSWEIQFAAFSGTGSICTAPWDDDGDCTGYLFAQRWSDPAPTLVWTGMHFSIFPMEIPFVTP